MAAWRDGVGVGSGISGGDVRNLLISILLRGARGRSRVGWGSEVLVFVTLGVVAEMVRERKLRMRTMIIVES